MGLGGGGEGMDKERKEGKGKSSCNTTTNYTILYHIIPSALSLGRLPLHIQTLFNTVLSSQ